MKSIPTILSNAIEDGSIPGAVFTLNCQGQTVFSATIGNRQVSPQVEAMTSDTIFDLASLTKVIGTWPAILVLLQNQKINLDSQVSDFLDLPLNSPLSEITILDLLTHTSGLPERTNLNQYGKSKQDIIQGFSDTGLKARKGESVLYSNRGFILLGFIIEEITGLPLDQFISKAVWEPFRMNETFFNPSPDYLQRIAPTEFRTDLGACQRGTVHDENAAWLNGIAGHAGAFSTIGDLSRFCTAIITKGQQILDDYWINQSLTHQTIGKNEDRGLAWEMLKDDNCAGQIWGHTGFTGTSIWLNPALDAFAILLTNRIHPSRENHTGIRQLRNALRRSCWDIIQS